MDEQQVGNLGFVDEQQRFALKADCENCFGLCCVALAFTASSDFAIDKKAGQPCPNLQADFRCGVHKTLRKEGFRGCTVYECFGAGQKVSQGTFGGQDWRHDGELAKQMFAVFPVMEQLHEMLWYLTEALTLRAAYEIHGELGILRDETERLTELSADVRDTDLSGANLMGSIFLTQVQLNAAKGNAQTKLPSSLSMPAHWEDNPQASKVGAKRG